MKTPESLQLEIDTLSKTATQVPPKLAGRLLMKVAALKREQIKFLLK